MKTPVSLAFHILILALLGMTYTPNTQRVVPSQVVALINDDPGTYPVPAGQLEPFKPHLPAHGIFSFIADVDHGKDKLLQFFFHDAQNFLCPLILNPRPEEQTAIIFCSTAEIAGRRMREFGYHWIKQLSPGKGIAAKS